MSEGRQALVERIFPRGIPTLWCPPLTHYTDDGALDRERIAAHVATMAPYVKGMLVPGSTGDGWEMDDDEQRELLDFVLGLAPQLGFHVLIGALRTDASEACQLIADTVAWLHDRGNAMESPDPLVGSRVCGFAFCAPKGADRTQQEIRDALVAILDLGLPSALYQLPQVTDNEIAPGTVAELAARYDHLYLVKDSSGGDRVATSGLVPDGVFLVRGAECDYHRWFAGCGGPYDGFLLSTANCFAPLLAQVIDCANAGRSDQAQIASELVSRAISGVFELVDDLPHGNRYTNANKAVDHFMAHGPSAAALAPPMLHAGVRLPQAVIDATGALLSQLGLMPGRGYLEG
ncbi:dihydrodipicolinate synthase family protein [Planctomycetota bacterium]